MHAAKNRALDRVRRNKLVDRKHEQIGAEIAAQPDRTVETLEERLKHIRTPLSLSVLGCVVNGPGEARETDLGFTGGGAGKEHGQVYVDGEPDHRIDNDQILDHLVELVEKKAAEIRAREEKESVAAE